MVIRIKLTKKRLLSQKEPLIGLPVRLTSSSDLFANDETKDPIT